MCLPVITGLLRTLFKYSKQFTNQFHRQQMGDELQKEIQILKFVPQRVLSDTKSKCLKWPLSNGKFNEKRGGGHDYLIKNN